MALVVILVLAGISLVTRQHNKPTPAVTLLVTTTQVRSVAPAEPSPALVTLTIPAPIQSSEEHQAAVDTEVNRLTDLIGKSDPASLAIVVNDLTSPDKEVRMEAIEVIKQSGSTNVIPTLVSDAASAPDLETQDALQQAVDFLALPVADFTDTGSGTPVTPEQAQASQQKYAAMQNLILAGRSNAHGGLNNPPPAMPAPAGNSH